MACNSKTASHRVVKFGESIVPFICIPVCGTFDPLVFKVILGSFGALVSDWPVTQKRLAVEQKGVKFGTTRGSYQLHRGYL